jgi:hypothetical protein
MTRERYQRPVRGIVVAVLVCVCAMISSCSTVRTVLSDLDADSFAAGDMSKDRRIPLPPMAEDFRPTGEGACPRPDAEH